MPTDPTDRRIALALFAAFWASFALIGPGFMVLNPNSISRMGYVFALVQDHVAHIDAVAAFTVDKAELGGHFYLDKAPGLSLMALPVIAILDPLVRLAGGATALVVGGKLSLYYILATTLVTLLTTAPLAAAAGAGVFSIARRLGVARDGALFAALLCGLCTPMLGWATVFFGHAAAAGCLVLGVATVLAAAEPSPPRHQFRAGAIAGLLLAWAVVIEFPAAPAALLIGLVGLRRLLAVADPPRLRRTLAGVVAGALVAGIPLAVYNALVFGSPFQLGYSHVVGFEGMQRGLFGIILPDPAVAVALLVGAKRGLLWLAPVLALTPLAWFAARRLPPDVLVCIVGIPLFLLAINAGYAYWDGGASTGPRHLVPALPFLALAFAPLWSNAGPAMRSILGLLAIVSLALSVLTATTAMGAPIWEDNPLPDYLVPRFLSGDTHNIVALAGDAGFGWLAILAAPWVLAARRLGWFRHGRRYIAKAPIPA